MIYFLYFTIETNEKKKCYLYYSVLSIKYRLVVLLETIFIKDANFFKVCVTLKHFLKLFFEMRKYYLYYCTSFSV